MHAHDYAVIRDFALGMIRVSGGIAVVLSLLAFTGVIGIGHHYHRDEGEFKPAPLAESSAHRGSRRGYTE